MTNRQMFRDESSKNSYLHAVEMTNAFHNLSTKSAQLLAKHNLMEAINAIRGTLIPVKPIGPDFGNGFKWSGGCLGPDGRVFFAPHTADHVLCINPFDGSISKFGDAITSSVVSTKFSGCVVGPRGLYLYLIPASSRYVIKLSLKFGTWVQLDTDLGSMEWKWNKGVLCGDRIFCSPHNSNFCLMIDCKQAEGDVISLIGDDYGTQSAKFGSPVIVPLNRQSDEHGELPVAEATKDVVIICPPLNASHVLVIDPVNNRTCLVGDEFETDNFKYDGACLGSDGAVYCAPSCATQFLRIEVFGKLVEEVIERRQSRRGDSGLMVDNDEEEKAFYDQELEENVSDTSTVTLLKQRMKNLLHVTSSSSSLSTPSRPSKVHIANSGNPILTSPSHRPIAKKLMSVTFDLGEECNNAPTTPGGILKKNVTGRMCYQWPPAVSLTYHGAERIGNFKFGAMALSADGKAAIAVPMNAGAFLSIDTSSYETEKPVRRIGPKLLAENLRFGAGIIGIDGYMYCSPLQADQVMRLDTLALSHHKHVHKHHHQKHEVEEGDKSHKIHHFSAAVSVHASLKNWQHAKASMLKLHQKTIEKSEKKKKRRKHSTQEEDEDTEDEEEKEEDEEEDEDDEEEEEEEKKKGIDIEALPAGKAMLAIRVYVRWKRFATKKARERQGYSASDRLIGNRDKHMKSLLLQDPDVWCFGLTLEDNSIRDDLCDWLEVFSTTETGRDFITTCGIDASLDTVMRVATLPNLMYSLISLVPQHDVLMKLPIVRKAIVKPSCFEGDWLVKCLSSRKLMEDAVDYVELVSEDIHMAHMEQVQRFLDDKKPSNDGENEVSPEGNGNGDDDESDDEEGAALMKNKTFEQIANIDHFVCPMLRLPTRLQQRIASTQLMGAVLDELFTERPLALLVLEFDFIFLFCLLSLLIRATWQVQHAGALRYDEILVILALTFFNFLYIIREYINYVAKKKLGLSAQIKPLDLLNMISLFAIVGMSMNKIRLTATFILVAALTSGLCWLKLAGFLSVIHLKFAVYIEALKIITRALRIYMITLVFFLAMFANMFFVVMKETGYGDDDEAKDQLSLIHSQFTYVHTSFLTLFRMLCGDFQMQWFQREGDPLLTMFAVLLFVLYMIGVFIIMLNVLIAVVCDSYSVALSEAHAIFLRSRMHIVANLDMQGLTKLRNANNDAGGYNDGSGGNDYGAGGAYYGHTNVKTKAQLASERKSFLFMDMLKHADLKHQDESVSACISRVINSFISSTADGLDRYLKDSKWHYYMRKFLVIGRDLNFKESLGKSSQLEIDNENEAMDMMKKIESRVKVLEEQQLLSENRIMHHIQDLARAIEHQSTIISRPPPPPPTPPVPPPPPPLLPPPPAELSPESLAVLIKATQDTVKETMKEMRTSMSHPILMRPPTSPPPLIQSRRGFNPRRSSSAKPSWAKGDNDP